MKSILDATFKYTPSAETDLAKSFARWRKEQGMPPLLKVVHPKQPSPLRISGILKERK